MSSLSLSNTATAAGTRRYNGFGHYLRSLFGRKVFKVNVDAGFTCPNRDGTVSVGGCIFCNNDSFRPSACTAALPLGEQIARGIPYLRSRYGAERFIVYFQPYSNTYAPVDVLERLYREALSSEGVIGLAIGTRPDCIDRQKISLLQDLAKDRFILVEYGLQSTHDSTLSSINRGHDYACFKSALELTTGKGIRIGAHIILGFPSEERDAMLSMADDISSLPVEFLKIHQLQVVKGTRLAELYEERPFPVLGYDEYLRLVADFLERLDPDIVIQRLFAAAPEGVLVAPVWDRTRSEFLRDLDALMEHRESFQGKRRSSAH